MLINKLKTFSHVHKHILSQEILCKDVNVSIPVLNPLVPSIPIDSLVKCDQFVGYLAVYRICMAVASFFFVLMLMMICVCSSKDPRSYIQNG